jgi:phosphoribosylglycinamide formyltransferase 1
MATSLASGSSEVLMRIGVLASGRGSNLEALLAANLDIVLVVANHPTARALLVAADHGVPTAVLARSAFPDAGARDEAIGEALRAARIELAVLAGYDQMLRPGYFAAYGGRTINIHPSLLPRHGGVGMMGAAVHRSVLAAGDSETGVTIHEVTTELDAGPILSQARVPVLPGDDADGLAARVLAVEHRLLVATVRDIAAASREVAAPAG